MPSKDHHRTFRELIEHEDKLIADRNTWFVLSQSFLFISFALTIGPITEKGVSPEALELGLFFQQIIIIIGLALSSITFFSVLAAIIAIGEVASIWKKARPEQNIISADALERRLLTGGGNKLAAILGYIAPFGFSVVFFCAWLFLIFQNMEARDRAHLNSLNSVEITSCTTP